MIIFKDKNWEIKIQISTKGTLYACLYFKSMPMGFVNIGSNDIQKMFYLDICPDLVTEAEQIRQEYFKKKGDN